MPSKPHDPEVPSAPTVSFRISGVQAVMIRGPDATDFLQRQCMNDVAELAASNQGQWSGLLSAKGRVLFLFRLNRDDDGYTACVLGGSALDCAAYLARFRFRSKVEIVPCNGEPEAGFGAAPAGAVGWDADRWIRLGDCKEPAAEPAVLPSAETPDAQKRWEWLDWTRGIPALGGAQQDRFTPQMLGLQRLRAFNLKKGCYPGQEIVARTHFLGQGKRSLRRVLGEAPINLGPLHAAEATVGEIIWISPGLPRHGLAVVSLDAAETAFDDSAVPVQLTMPDSGTTP